VFRPTYSSTAELVKALPPVCGSTCVLGLARTWVRFRFGGKSVSDIGILWWTRELLAASRKNRLDPFSAQGRLSVASVNSSLDFKNIRPHFLKDTLSISCKISFGHCLGLDDRKVTVKALIRLLHSLILNKRTRRKFLAYQGRAAIQRAFQVSKYLLGSLWFQ